MSEPVANQPSSAQAAAQYRRWPVFLVLLIVSVLGFIASFVLSIESLQLAKNPDAALACNLNATVNCATVAKHPSASLLGFPNSFIGIAAEAVMITVALLGLFGGRLPKKFTLLMTIGVTAGWLFALWLFITSAFVIGALCPWCLVITSTMTIMWVMILRLASIDQTLPLPKKIQQVLVQKIVKSSLDIVVLVALLTTLAAVIIVKYGDALFG